MFTFLHCKYLRHIFLIHYEYCPIINAGGAMQHEGQPVWSLKKTAIEQSLKACGSNTAGLGISEKSIYNKMKRYGIS